MTIGSFSDADIAKNLLLFRLTLWLSQVHYSDNHDVSDSMSVETSHQSPAKANANFRVTDEHSGPAHRSTPFCGRIAVAVCVAFDAPKSLV
jgi:hypothetical protein